MYVAAFPTAYTEAGSQETRWHKQGRARTQCGSYVGFTLLTPARVSLYTCIFLFKHECVD